MFAAFVVASAHLIATARQYADPPLTLDGQTIMKIPVAPPRRTDASP